MSVCLSLRPSVAMEQLGPNWTDFHEISYLSILRKYVEEIQVTLQPDKDNGYLAWTPKCIYDSMSQIRLAMGNVSNIFLEKIKTHISCSVIFFSENLNGYEITWKNVLQPDRP